MLPYHTCSIMLPRACGIETIDAAAGSRGGSERLGPAVLSEFGERVFRRILRVRSGQVDRQLLWHGYWASALPVQLVQQLAQLSRRNVSLKACVFVQYLSPQAQSCLRIGSCGHGRDDPNLVNLGVIKFCPNSAQ